MGLLSLGLPFARAEKTLPDGTPVYLIDASVEGSDVPYECSPIFISDFRSGSEAFASFQELNDYLAGHSKYGTSNTTKVIVYVNPGTYGAANINVPNLEFRGANAYCGWEKTVENKVQKVTMTRGEESIINGVITVGASNGVSNMTFNGFKITGAGQIMVKNGFTAIPQSGFKFLYNYVTASTLKSNSAVSPVVKVGSDNGDTSTDETAGGAYNLCLADRHRRYFDIEVAHNRFEGVGSTTGLTGSNYPIFVGLFNSYNVLIHDNCFDGGGTSIQMQAAQENLNITNNRFVNVGNNTNGGYCVLVDHSAHSNFTNLNIESNEFLGCQGYSGIKALVRLDQGTAAVVTPVNMKLNLRYNIITGKTEKASTTIVAGSDGYEQRGENVIFYCDKVTGDKEQLIDFDIADNHSDNRFYKICNVKLRDGLGARDVYTSNYGCFTLSRHDKATYCYSMFNSRSYHTTIASEEEAAAADEAAVADKPNRTYEVDASRHLERKSLSSGTVMQSFDIDALTADIYTSQVANDEFAASFRTTHGLTDDYLVLDLNRLDCTTKATTGHAGGSHVYSTELETMRISKAGQGLKLSLVRDLSGELYLITGADGRPIGLNPKNGVNLTSDISGNYVALFKWKSGGELVLDPNAPPADVIFVKHPEATGTDDYLDTYATVDEVNRYICFASLEYDATEAKTNRTYCFYDLDEFLKKYVNGSSTEKLRLLKKLSFKEGSRETARNADDVYNDDGFETWPVQSFAIMGDYLFVLEGNGSNSETHPIVWINGKAWKAWAEVNTSQIMLTTINWRTGVLFKRERILEPIIGTGKAATSKDNGVTRINSMARAEGTDGTVTYSPGESTYVISSYTKPEGITIRPNVFGHVDFYLGVAMGDGGARTANFYKYFIDRVVRDGVVKGSDYWPYTRHMDEGVNCIDDNHELVTDPLKTTGWLYPGVYMKMDGFAKDENGDVGTGFYDVANNSTPSNSQILLEWGIKNAAATHDADKEYRVRADSKQGLHFEAWDVDHQPELTLGLAKNRNVATKSEFYSGVKYNHCYSYGAWTATVIGTHGHLFSAEIEDNDRFTGDITTTTSDSEAQYINVKVKFNGYAAPVETDPRNFYALLRLSAPGANDMVIPLRAHTRNIPTGVANLTDGNKDYPVEWYNIQGMRVDEENLVPGIYIRRQGSDVKKVYIQ